MATARLRNGQPVTEELIEEMVREAEAGYTPSQIRSLRLGRPPLGDGSSFRVQFRVSPATFDALLARAQAEDRGVSEIARIALEAYLCCPTTCAPTDAASTTQRQE
jgi:hypothetical protein